MKKNHICDSLYCAESFVNYDFLRVLNVENAEVAALTLGFYYFFRRNYENFEYPVSMFSTNSEKSELAPEMLFS